MDHCQPSRVTSFILPTSTMVLFDDNSSARSKSNAIDMFNLEVDAALPVVQIINHDNEDQSSQSSAPLPASSPLTDGDDHTESEVEDGKAGRDSAGGKHSNNELGRTTEIEATATAVQRDSAKGRAPLSPSPSPSIADNLRRVLHKLEQYRLGKPLAPPDCEQIGLALEPAEHHQLCQLLFGPELQVHDFDCDLAALRRWAPNKLRHEYDPRAARFTIRMLGPLHQKLVEGLKSIILERLVNALATSGHNGSITENTGIDAIFKEPQPESEPRSSTTPRPRAVPQRSRPQNDRLDVSTTDPDSGNASNELGETSPTSVEHTYSPDFGIYYAPHEGQEPYFPGIIVEVGWSHPLPDWKAKRYIRYGKGNVRYVMAVNVEHQPKHSAMPSITIQAHEIASDQESWFPAKCLHAYDVRANAEVEARGAGGDAAETDLGLRLSHLHELLVPGDHVDIPITLPLRNLVDIVEAAYNTQVRRDAVKTGQVSPSLAASFRGKRCRTATPIEDDDGSLLRDPDASYIPQDSQASSKRRRTEQGGT